MLSKPVGSTWTAILGVAALLAVNTAHAEINLDADDKSAAVATYAMETLVTNGMKVTARATTRPITK